MKNHELKIIHTGRQSHVIFSAIVDCPHEAMAMGAHILRAMPDRAKPHPSTEETRQLSLDEIQKSLSL